MSLNTLPACREGRQSTALAGLGSSGLMISNQADTILAHDLYHAAISPQDFYGYSTLRKQQTLLRGC
ncbi:MAG: hypothetical protein ACKO2Z_01990 [Sphaerospermopsis kisseleviana]